MTLPGNSFFSLKSCYRSFVSPAPVVTSLITLDCDWVPLLHWARNPAELSDSSFQENMFFLGFGNNAA